MRPCLKYSEVSSKRKGRIRFQEDASCRSECFLFGETDGQVIQIERPPTNRGARFGNERSQWRQRGKVLRFRKPLHLGFLCPRIALYSCVMSARPLRYLLVFLIVPLVLGPLLAPWVYLGVQKLVGFSLFSGLAEERFERVATRTVQVIALLLVWPCLKRSGTVERVAPMMRRSRGRVRMFLGWAAIGIAMIAVVYGVGVLVGNYSLSEKYWGTPKLYSRVSGFLLGATLVGVFEEYLFRGFIFGALRSRFSFAGAAIASSAFFSSLHFFRPRVPTPLTEMTWFSGFQLFPHMFELFKPLYDWDYALTLFFMGIILCALLVRHGHLYGIAGLHAGWVWALQTGALVFDQRPEHHSFLFGWGDGPAQGALVTFLALILAIYAWRTRDRASSERDAAPAD